MVCIGQNACVTVLVLVAYIQKHKEQNSSPELV